MYRIVDARDVGLKIRQFTIEAPRIARKQRPGQFVILRVRESGERIPLTIKSRRPGRRNHHHLRAVGGQDHLAAELS